MEALPILNGLGQDDGDDHAILNTTNLVPSELTDGVGRSNAGREDVAPTEHCEEQEESCILQYLQRDSLDVGGIGRRSRKEEIGEDRRGDRTTPPRGCGEDAGRALHNGEEGAVLGGAWYPTATARRVDPERGEVLPEAVSLGAHRQHEPHRVQANIVRRWREAVDRHFLREPKIRPDLD